MRVGCTMDSFEFDIGEKATIVSRFMGEIHAEIQQAFIAEKVSRKLTQQQIATLLEVNRSVINRQLQGMENLTARRIAEFAWALGYEPEFRLRKDVAEHGTNDRPAKPPVSQSLPGKEAPTSVGKSGTYLPSNLLGFQVVAQ